jgi:hypothetical protein
MTATPREDSFRQRPFTIKAAQISDETLEAWRAWSWVRSGRAASGRRGSRSHPTGLQLRQ